MSVKIEIKYLITFHESNYFIISLCDVIAFNKIF